jgi:superfamily II DNA/RNA helicase
MYSALRRGDEKMIKLLKDSDRAEERPLTMQRCKHWYVQVEKEEWKLDTMQDLLECDGIGQMVIYCSSSKRASNLHASLRKRNFRCESITKEMEMDEQERILEQFENGSLSTLILNEELYDPVLNERNYVRMLPWTKNTLLRQSLTAFLLLL